MIVLGRIVAPFGIKGWVRIAPFGDDPESWGEMPQWWISRDDQAPESAWQPVEVSECRTHGTGLIAALKEVADRNAAEAVKGWFVGAPREALPEPGEEEYYWADLVGLAVENKDGERLGEVADLMSTGAHDVLRVVDGDTERLIPFVAAYALEVDLQARRITVDWQKDW
ncbi:MAG: ribosome maturation factor RimM [Pseudazoarcus pumilus]|nr:ribosome maturation factor RimM [Pseudazoarcus pumilus]